MILIAAGWAAAPACAPAGREVPVGTAVEFRPGDLGVRLAPRFLPAPVSIPLSAAAGEDAPGPGRLEGFLRLGPKLEAGEAGFPLFIESRPADGSFELLYAEEGGRAGEAPRRVEPTAGHLGEEPIFRLDLLVEHLLRSGPYGDDYVVEILPPPAAGSSQPELLTGYGFGERIARVEVEGRALTVLLSDGNSDGIFGMEDHWVVLEDAHLLAAPFTSEMAREVGDFAWAGGRAWTLRLEGTAGLAGALVPHDPGLTGEEDGNSRKSWARDRSVERASIPFRCPPAGDSRDSKAVSPGGGSPGSDEGDAAGAPRLLLFDMGACAQCRALDSFVFTAARVAEAGEPIGCRRIDVEADPGSMREYGLAGVPSGILLDADGLEITRFEGYRGVTEMAAIFRRATR